MLFLLRNSFERKSLCSTLFEPFKSIDFHFWPLVSFADEMAAHVRIPHGTEAEMDGFNNASSSEVSHSKSLYPSGNI